MDIVIIGRLRNSGRWRGEFRRQDATFPVEAIHVTDPSGSGWRFAIGAPSEGHGRQRVVYPDGDMRRDQLYPSLDDALEAAKAAVGTAKVVDTEALLLGEHRAFQRLLSNGRVRCRTCGRRLSPKEGLGYAGAFVDPYRQELRDEVSWPPVRCGSCQEKEQARAIQTDYEAHLQPPLVELLRQWKDGEERGPASR